MNSRRDDAYFKTNTLDKLCEELETEAAEAPQNIEKQPEQETYSVWSYLGGWFGYSSNPAAATQEKKPAEEVKEDEEESLRA